MHVSSLVFHKRNACSKESPSNIIYWNVIGLLNPRMPLAGFKFFKRLKISWLTIFSEGHKSDKEIGMFGVGLTCLSLASFNARLYSLFCSTSCSWCIALSWCILACDGNFKLLPDFMLIYTLQAKDLPAEDCRWDTAIQRDSSDRHEKLKKRTLIRS